MFPVNQNPDMKNWWEITETTPDAVRSMRKQIAHKLQSIYLSEMELSGFD